MSEVTGVLDYAAEIMTSAANNNLNGESND